MKKLLIILILFPTLLMAQQDSTKQTFKIGGCNIILAEKYHNKDTILLSELLESPCINIGCGEVFSFFVDFQVPNGAWGNASFAGSCMSGYVLSLLSQRDSKYSYLVIKNVKYATSKGIMRSMNGITVIVKKG